MIFFKSPVVKLKSFKDDIAPVGFYFDIFPTEYFKIPIFPLPMRVDKLSNGEPTLFINLEIHKLDALCEKLDLAIDFKLFYSIGIKNLIEYAKIKKKELTSRDLERKKVKNWWRESNSFSSNNLDLIESFTFINAEFIKMYSNIIQNNINSTQGDFRNTLIRYCESIVDYFRIKIEKNIFYINIDNELKEEKLYLERKNKFYPLIIKMPVHDKINDKVYEMGFVPYLIYEDLLDCFSYNLNLLKTKDYTINLKVYKDNLIINKRSNISDIEVFKQNIRTFKIQDIDLDKLLQ
ncbi:MAG: hypothetical protein ACFFA2_06605 [Promethearchaeota archaeon]